ncbi:MAG: ABC transporter ATP-binding protein [Clostridium sp.]|uniref:ABC transporter ATP-binding protein n=1 Tax=Clostridium sp. TaxID=1506 RepID=UPI003EE60C81
MEIIKLVNINKIYGKGTDAETVALKEVNLTIEEGDFIAIIGPSGSGKSTLLNLLGCIDNPSSGSYFLKGKDVSSLKGKELAKIRNEEFGFIFQNFNLLYDYNLIDNVALPLEYSKKKVSKITAATDMLKSLGLLAHKLKTPKELSGGQKQRVAIGRALINEPQIILADEPTGALDQKTGVEVLEMLKNINEDGKTVIIITHDINIAKQCKKMIKIEDGLLEELVIR